MRDSNEIACDRQRAIRRELDRRRVSLKAVSFDSGIPYSTIVSYFPASEDAKPALIGAGAMCALCGALPLDLLSLLLPDGFQIIRAPEGLDHDRVAELAADYVSAKNAAHHPESEAGRDIGPHEDAVLTAKVVALRAA